MEPKKANAPLIWGWKHKEKGASTQVSMKLKFIFPEVQPDVVFNAYHPNVRP